jgi:hypothetical protein
LGHAFITLYIEFAFVRPKLRYGTGDVWGDRYSVDPLERRTHASR